MEEEQLRQDMQNLTSSEMTSDACLRRLAFLATAHQTELNNGRMSQHLLGVMMELTLLRLEQIISAASIQVEREAGASHEPSYPGAWQCGMQAYNILREGINPSGKDEPAACMLQELCFGFWENIAALLLQPDLSDGLQPYLDLTTALRRAGALRPVLADLHSASNSLGLPFLAHADVQPAACLLMLLEATSDEERWEEGTAREAAAVLHMRLEAPACSFQERASLLGPVFQTSAWQVYCMARSGHFVSKWLQQLRSTQPQDPAFDACVSATCAGVLDAVTCHGMRALQAPKVAAALACIAQRSNAALIMRSLLASQHCKDAPGRAMLVAILTACLAGDAEALLLGCAAALEPEASCPLDMRVHCLKTMESVCNEKNQSSDSADSGDSGSEAKANDSALTWPAHAADLLLYTLTNDPSIRARRAAIKTLKAARCRLGSIGGVIKVLLLKCRDRDKRVQLCAYELLASMGAGDLHRALSLSQWRNVLDAGLGVWQAAQQTEDGKKEDEHSTELRWPTLALLGAYLKVSAGQAGSALEALRALGCFQASTVAESYCEAMQEHAGHDAGMKIILSQLVAGCHH